MDSKTQAGSTALVTGGAHRLGRAIADALAERGCGIVVHYHSSAREAEEAAAAISNPGVAAALLRADLAEPAQVESLWRRALEAADHAADDTPAVVLDAAPLYESESEDICDAVVFVDAPDELRRQRVKTTRGWDWEEVRRREDRQFPSSRKRQMADFVIQNTSDLDHLRREAHGILDRVRKRFLSPGNNKAPCVRADRGRRGRPSV